MQADQSCLGLKGELKEIDMMYAFKSIPQYQPVIYPLYRDFRGALVYMLVPERW